MTERPAISKLTITALLAAGLLSAANFVPSFSVAAFLWACGAILGFVALVLTGEYILAVIDDCKTAAAERIAITPRRREIEAISHLRPDQIPLVSKPESQFILSGSKTSSGFERALWFSTQGGLVPYDFAQEFLRSGGVLNLRPISSYSEGTFSYEYARNLTTWARAEGLAVGGEGSKSGRVCEWTSPAARAMAFELFDVSCDLDQEIERLR